jgi:hypothetical protein
MRISDQRLFYIATSFRIDGTPESIFPHGTGHIHDSFLVRTGKPAGDCYLLQRINHSVFRNIQELTDNLLLITNHIGRKIKEAPEDICIQQSLTCVPARDGRNYFPDDEGKYWRMFHFIRDARTYEHPPTTHLACQGGKGFGAFIRLLSDLQPGRLRITIPDFHDLSSRIGKLTESMRMDAACRKQHVAAEIDFTLWHADALKQIQELGRKGRLPLRITHNDTKINNILFDKDDNILAVIDLDTVMPGYIHYDYGDAVRTFANSGREEETDLARVTLDMDIFEAFTRGFLEETGSLLNKDEKETLAKGPLLLTYIMGIRFLTDYLSGDVYYKISYLSHNLDRARAQFRLLEDMKAKLPLMEETIRKCLE